MYIPTRFCGEPKKIDKTVDPLLYGKILPCLMGSVMFVSRGL